MSLFLALGHAVLIKEGPAKQAITSQGIKYLQVLIRKYPHPSGKLIRSYD